MNTPANPKQIYGDKKPDLRLLPLSGQLAQWEAHKDGANKYGPFNWRENAVEANTYINAAKRHLELYAAGEEKARDTGVHNLGAVMACCAILIDAALHDRLIDNRHKSKQECDLLHKMEDMVKSLRDAQDKRELEAKQKKVRKSEHPWNVSYCGAVPNLKGYRSIEVEYLRPSYLHPSHPYPVIREVVQWSDSATWGIDWKRVSRWRRVD